MVYSIDMIDIRVIDFYMVNMMLVNMGMIVAGVVELMVGKLEVVDLVVEVVGEDCLKEAEVVNENYLINRGGGGRLFNECSYPLRYAPSARIRSSNVRDSFLVS